MTPDTLRRIAATGTPRQKSRALRQAAAMLEQALQPRPGDWPLTGQRYSHTTARGEHRTVDVLVVQERLEADPLVALRFNPTGAVFTLPAAAARRWLRRSTLQGGST